MQTSNRFAHRLPGVRLSCAEFLFGSDFCSRALTSLIRAHPRGLLLRTYRIATIPGDGIGKEVVPAGRHVLEVLARASNGFRLEFEEFDWGGDYYRRYGEILRANTYKPATPWLEEGLFTGPNDAATPFTFRILGSRAIGDSRVDVELGFTTKQTYSPDLGLPRSYDHYEGDVTAILENKRWVIDDYVAMYENDDLRRLSAGYPQCKDGQWVGETPY